MWTGARNTTSIIPLHCGRSHYTYVLQCPCDLRGHKSGWGWQNHPFHHVMERGDHGDRTASPLLNLQVQTGSIREESSPRVHRDLPPFPQKLWVTEVVRWAEVNLINIAPLLSPLFFFLLKKPIRIRGLGIKWKPDSLTCGTSFIYSTIRFLSAEHY